MAETTAPVLSKSRTATLTNLSAKSKEKSKKLSTKNVLCQESFKWPRPDSQLEEQILTELNKILKDCNIFKNKNDSPETKALKVSLRSQIDIGVSSVFRSLEKDALSCILVSGTAQPAMSVEHVITLARERGCPLLCLDKLASSIATATGSKCLPLAVGFRQEIPVETPACFHAVVKLVKENTTVKKPSVSLNSPKPTLPKERADDILKKCTLRPLKVTTDGEAVIMKELQSVIMQNQAPVVKSEHKKNKKRRKKKHKRNLKDAVVKSCSNQFEIGKRTVQDILGLNKLQLILVSEAVADILMLEGATSVTSPSCLLQLAAKRGCPVLRVLGLTNTLKPLLNGNVAVFGIKKLSSVPENTEKCFEKLLRTIVDLTKSGAIMDENSKDSDTSVKEKKESQTKNLEKSENAKAKSAHQARQKWAEKDYTYLYVMKKDSEELQERLRKRKAEEEKILKNMTFSSDFISLSGASSIPETPSLSTAKKPKLSSQKRNQTGVALTTSKQDSTSLPTTSPYSSSSRNDKSLLEEGTGLLTSKKKNQDDNLSQRESDDVDFAQMPGLFVLDRLGGKETSDMQTKNVSQENSCSESLWSSTGSKNNCDGLKVNSTSAQETASGQTGVSKETKESLCRIENQAVETGNAIVSESILSTGEAGCEQVSHISEKRSNATESDVSSPTAGMFVLDRAGAKNDASIPENAERSVQSEISQSKKSDVSAPEGKSSGLSRLDQTESKGSEIDPDSELKEKEATKTVSESKTMESDHSAIFGGDATNKDKILFSSDRVGDIKSSKSIEELLTSSDKTSSASTGELSVSESMSSSQVAFVLDRSGNGASIGQEEKTKEIGNKNSSAKREERTMTSKAVLGDETLLPATSTGFNVLAMHQPAGRWGGAGKKRKFEQQDGYLSFGYTEANIHTMVANPSNKKKKKKKK